MTQRVDYGPLIDNPITIGISWCKRDMSAWYEYEYDSAVMVEACVWVIEQWGLPGDRYTTSPTQHGMDFHFKNEQDAVFFSLKWGWHD